MEHEVEKSGESVRSMERDNYGSARRRVIRNVRAQNLVI